MAKAIDLTGQDFNYLHVIERDYEAQKAHPSERQAWWKCECKACGTIKSMRGSVIRKGKSCGCIQERKLELSDKQKAQIAKLADQNRLDLTNQRFSHLTVLAYAPENKQIYYNGHHQITWLCKCDCGNECYVTTQNLRRGDTTSCGCAIIEARKKQIKDLTGQKFGHLTAIERVESDKYGHARWKCRCDCQAQTELIVHADNLRRGHTRSCGCDRRSHGELTVEQLLRENDIPFIQEYKPFRFSTGANASFDFYIDNKYIIEYDGETHYKYNLHGWHDEYQMKAQQERDIIKTQWCKENNIPLIRIPYWHLKDLTIEDLKLETSKFII